MLCKSKNLQKVPPRITETPLASLSIEPEDRDWGNDDHKNRRRGSWEGASWRRELWPLLNPIGTRQTRSTQLGDITELIFELLLERQLSVKIQPI